MNNSSHQRSRDRTARFHSAAVVGLGGVGSSVALQLAALGVRRLQLIDASNVSQATHKAEGYSHEDVGRPRVHATAYACHLIDPGLDVTTAVQSKVKSLRPSDVWFCCPASLAQTRAILRRNDGQTVARCVIADSVINLGFARGVAGLTKSLRAQIPVWGPMPRHRVPVPVSTIAAGLMVSEAIRFLNDRQIYQVVLLDLQSREFSVEKAT